MGKRACPEVMVVKRCPLTTESGRSSSNMSRSFGFQSKVSNWLGAPDMNR